MGWNPCSIRAGEDYSLNLGVNGIPSYEGVFENVSNEQHASRAIRDRKGPPSKGQHLARIVGSD